MNSHIQFPKTLLKNFTNSKNELYYYSFQDNLIKKDYPKFFNTEKGYYDEDIEEAFSKNIERPLGIVIKSVLKPDFYRNNPNPNIREIAKDYVYSIIARDPGYLQEVEKLSIFTQFLPEEEKRNYVIPYGLVCAHNKDLLSIFSFGIGTTEKALVLNSNGLVQCPKYILAPITPNRAFVFYLPKKQQDNTIVPLIDLTSETDYINKITFTYELQHNKRFVLANSEELLKQLIKELIL